MILLWMFYCVRPVNFDDEAHVHIDDWCTSTIFKHRVIMNVISDDIKLSYYGRDKAKGTKYKIQFYLMNRLLLEILQILLVVLT